MSSNATCPVCRTADIVCGKWTLLVIRDLAEGRSSPYAAAHDPKRKTPSAIGEFLRENLTVVENLAEHLAGGEVSSPDQLQPGQGALVRQGLTKIAAYRDEAGELHLLSAVCTHAGCVVHWNPLERCWDCPCHGSQFAIDGTALNGPAIAPLSRLESR